MTTSCTDPNHPFYKPILKLDPSKRTQFFTANNCQNMTYVSLGEALDFISAGASMNAVYWNEDIKGLTNFVKSWMDVQKPRLTHERVQIKNSNAWTTRLVKTEYNYNWNRFDQDFDEDLPWVNFAHCPRDSSHKDILKNGNIIRCAHVDHLYTKPSFTEEQGPYNDDLSGFMRPDFIEIEPRLHDGLPEPEDDKDREEILIAYSSTVRENKARLEKFNSEKPELIIDPCYALISDKGSLLSLETVLNRVNVNKNLSGPGSLFPFTGFTIASYVKTWYNQPGKKLLYSPRGRIDDYKILPNFVSISSED